MHRLNKTLLFSNLGCCISKGSFLQIVRCLSIQSNNISILNILIQLVKITKEKCDTMTYKMNSEKKKDMDCIAFPTECIKTKNKL